MSCILEVPGALHTPDGNWSKEIEIEEMTGVEEDILADQTKDPSKKGRLAKNGPKRITEILSRVTARIGKYKRPEGKTRFTNPDFFEEVWKQAYSFDRSFTIVRLRQLSLGDLYVFSDVCPKCGHEGKNEYHVDLAKDLKVTSLPLEEAKRHTQSVRLPNGEEVEWRFLTAEDEIRQGEILKQAPDQVPTMSLFQKLVKVGGDKPSFDKIKQMSTKNRNFLLQAMDEKEAGIEMVIHNTCPECDHDFSTMLNAGERSFFFPSATSLPSRAKSSPLPTHGISQSSESFTSPSAVEKEHHSGGK